MEVGVVPDPRGWEHWPQAEAYLEPARKMGGFESVLDDDECLFAVMDGDTVLGVATTWLSVRNYVEVKLVGGKDYRRWLKPLNDKIGAVAAEAGATHMMAFGRPGWRKALKAIGWAVLGVDADGFCTYAREL